MCLSTSVMNDFAAWADAALRAARSSPARAYNFNLYEAPETWDVELIGASVFDEADSTWACDSVFSYPELFFIRRSVVCRERENGLSAALGLVTTYIRGGREREVLRSSIGVGVGFVTGDLTIVWPDRAA